MTSALTASSFSSSTLGSTATSTAVLYQRTAYNAIGASASTATNIGTLATNSTQLDVVSQVTPTNQASYYAFTLDGTSLKASFSNVTGSDTLRYQVYDSKGKVVADSQGTSEQQIAYVKLTTSGGLDAKKGQYVLKVSYGTGATRAIAQNYSVQLYSGTRFEKSYQTTAAPQTSTKTHVPVDNTLTYATYDARLYERQTYNTIGSTVLEGVNIGWLAENKSALKLTSQLTRDDSTEYYQFTLQRGDNLKFAFNNQTATSDLRVQILNSTGTQVLADNYGTAKQKATYESLTSSSGLAAKAGQYAVKITYAPEADRTKTQTYNFHAYSGDTYAASYETIASAQTLANAFLTGNTRVAGYNPASAVATYLNSVSQGSETDIFSTLSTLA